MHHHTFGHFRLYHCTSTTQGLYKFSPSASQFHHLKIWGYLDLYGVKKLYLFQVVLLIFCINLAIAGSKMLWFL